MSPFASKLKAYDLHLLYGFGYDQSTDDYLVVLLSYDQTLTNRSVSHLELFSLRDNTWNQIGDPHLTYFNAAPIVKVGSFFNGAFHWVARRNDLSVDVIVFDLMERKLLEMPLPDDFDNSALSYGLWVFGESLSLWSMDFRNRRVEI